MRTAEADIEKEESSLGSAVPTETGVAYTRGGDGVREERLGATDPDASLYDDATAAAQAKAMSDMRELEQKIAEIQRNAAARGEDAPNITLPQIDPRGVTGQDLVVLQQEIDRIEERVRHEQGKDLQQSVGGLVGFAAALGAIGGSEGMLASLGISGGKNVNDSSLFTPDINHGIGALGLQQQKDRQNALPDM